MRSIFKNERGVALILVLSAIVMLTMLAVEFAYDNQVEYQMAKHQLERLQAYYLAESANHLVRLELKMNQTVQNTVANSELADKIQIDLTTPLCQQFPMSSSLIRAALSGALTGAATETPPEGESEASEETSEAAAAAGMLAGLPLQGGEEFVKFEGDFDGECIDESSKLDLNAFATLDPERQVEGQENPYDALKRIVIALLSQEEFKPLFETGEERMRIDEIVRNIADWVDPNETVNDFRGVAVGSESGEPKNGKFTTLGDVFRVEGVSDTWWTAVADYFTVYGDGKINVCRATDELVRALILRYTATRQDLPPIQSKDRELLDQLVQSVRDGCQGVRPDPKAIEQSLNTKLTELLGATPPPGTPGGALSGARGGSFSEWISSQSRFFTLKSAGQIGDTVVRITSVIDLGEGSGADPSKWKVLYWRVD